MKDEHDHWTEVEIDKYLHRPRELSQGQAQEIKARLAECEGSRERVMVQARRDGCKQQLFVSSSESPVCPSKELLWKYIRKTTEDCEDEIVEMHIEDCPVCKAWVEEKTAFCEEIENDDWVTEPVIFETGSVAESKERKTSWWRNWLPQQVLPWGATATAAVLALYFYVDRNREVQFLASGKQAIINDLQLEKQKLLAAEKQLSDNQKRLEDNSKHLAQVEEKINQLNKERRFQIAQADAYLEGARDVSQLREGHLIKPELLPPPSNYNFRGEYKGPNQQPALICPVHTTILDTKPVFEWIAHPGAKGYRVTVVALKKEEGVAFSGELSPNTTRWTCTTPLKRGEQYEWQLEFLDSEQPAVRSVFEVLNDKTAKEVLRVKDREPDPLVLGLYYWKVGLIDDAIRLWEKNQQNGDGRKALASARKLKTEALREAYQSK